MLCEVQLMKRFAFLLLLCAAGVFRAGGVPPEEPPERHKAEIDALLRRVGRLHTQLQKPVQKIRKLRRLAVKVQRSGLADLLNQYVSLKTRAERRQLADSNPSLFKVVLTAGLIGVPALILARIVNEINVRGTVNSISQQLDMKRAQLRAEADKTESLRRHMEEKLGLFMREANGLFDDSKNNIKMFREELNNKLGHSLI